MAKTQKEIRARLNAYKNGTVDSKYKITKPTSYDARFGTMEPGVIDADKYFHGQCMDLVIDYVLWLTDNKLWLKGESAAVVPERNKFPSGWKLIKNQPETIAKEGWIVVFKGGSYTEHGHIGIVYETGDLNKFVIIEQNWNGYANKKPSLRTDYYENIYYFIAPEVAPEKKEEVKKEVKAAAKPAAKPSAPKQKTPSTKKVVRYSNNIKNYTMDSRGKNPSGIVLHNDAGSKNAVQYMQELEYAPLGRLERGVAHSYVSKGMIWEAISEDRVAWHTANADGNRNYYGMEICQSMSASDKDFLENEQTAFEEAARLFKKWGLEPNRNTVRLHMEFVYTECPHRSMVLHTGFDPVKQGRPNDKTMLILKDYFIAQIKSYMKGQKPVSTVSVQRPGKATTPATVKNNGWKKNQYGTLYRSEKATFTPNTAIITRYIGPFTSCPQAGVLKAGQSINYDEVLVQDKHVWVGYTAYDGQRVYLPIRTHVNGVDGPLWGTIK